MSDLARILDDVDAYIERLFAPPDEALEAALREAQAAGLPPIHISPNEGKLIHLIASILGARRILEIGLLGGYSGIWLARALPKGGRLISLEISDKHAAVGRKNFERAGLTDRTEVRIGPALPELDRMIREGEAPFDLVFIDADKTGYPEYLERAVRLTRPGGVILADNLIRGGKVLQEEAGDADLRAIQRFNRELAVHPRLEAIILPIMRERLDGISIARVKN